MSKQTQPKPPPELEVIVIVRGGVAELLQKPLGVTVVILDYELKVSTKPILESSEMLTGTCVPSADGNLAMR